MRRKINLETHDAAVPTMASQDPSTSRSATIDAYRLAGPLARPRLREVRSRSGRNVVPPRTGDLSLAVVAAYLTQLVVLVAYLTQLADGELLSRRELV